MISNKENMGLRKPPLVYTEQSVAMLSSVMNSPYQNVDAGLPNGGMSRLSAEIFRPETNRYHFLK